MRVLLTLAFLTVFLLPISASAQMESYDDVLLIVNDRSSASRDIADYFATRRGIPDRHIYHIDVDSSESMDSASFVTLKWRLQDWMRSRNLVDSINYIVTTKGCPLRVTTVVQDGTVFGGLASFEDLLVLINGADSVRMLVPRSGFFANRYYNATQRFRRDPVSLPMYLVTRLDAYTVDQVKSYILRAETPAVLGDGLWMLDVAPSRDNPSYKVGNDWLRAAAAILMTKGLNVYLDTTTVYIHDQKNVIGYGSWGSNDGSSGGGEAAKPGNTWLNGSIAETSVSTSGRSFKPGTSYGQSLIADWVAEGACGVKGYTNEPYLTSIAHYDILFDRYTSGWNMAESFFAASQLSAWRQVVIGDPKMKLGRLLASASIEVDFGSDYRWIWRRDTVTLRPASSSDVEVTALTIVGGDSLDFAASVIGGPLPRTVKPGDSIRLEVGFRASVYRKELSSLAIAHRKVGGSGGASVVISLAGTGLRPVLAVDDTVDFGLAPGSNPVRREAIVRNMTVSDTLDVRSLVLGGTDKARFRLDTSSISLPYRIAGGDSVAVPVEYLPTGVGGHVATLTVTATSQFPLVVRLVGRSSTSGVPLAENGNAGMIRSIDPNPSSTHARVAFSVPCDGCDVVLEVCDMTGRAVLVREEHGVSKGENILDLDLRTLPAGHYLCRLTVRGQGNETISLDRVVIER